MKKDKEFRNIVSLASPSESRTIAGSIPYNSVSEYLGFYEILDPRCFEKTIRESKDIKVFYQHNETKPLARTKNNSLRLENTDTELRFEFDVPSTSDGDDLLTLVRDGIIDGCSFGMIVINDKWEIKDGIQVRTVLEAKLFEISPVTEPAYSETNIHVRSLSDAFKDKESLDDNDKLAIQSEIDKLSNLLPKEDKSASTQQPEPEHQEPATPPATTLSAEDEKQLSNLNERLDKVSEILNRGLNYGN